MSPVDQGTSTRPYLIRALHDWCTDNGFTPYIAVHVDETVEVPREYVKNNEIVLNVGFEATSGLELGNEFICFKARFGGVARDIAVPVGHVVAIYARENGQGMAFPMPALPGTAPSMGTDAPASGAGAGTLGTPRRSTRLAAVPAGVDAATDTESASGPGAEATAPALDVGRSAADASTDESSPRDEPPSPGDGGGRPALKRIK